MPVNKTYIIGLTGGTGCGKTEAAKYLAFLGATVLDADAISHALTQENGAALPEIRARFGDEVFFENGMLDRTKLGKIVFCDAGKRHALEGIMHPLIQRTMLKALDEAEAQGIPVVILDVPLLFETGMDTLCDETWSMYVPEDVQIARIIARDHIDEEQAKNRIASQMSMEERNARATRCINSDRPQDRTQAELQSLYSSVLKRL